MPSGTRCATNAIPPMFSAVAAICRTGRVSQSANTGGESSSEINANQLQVDSILDTINRISGSTTFEKYLLIDDSSAMIGDLEETLLDGAAFYMHRSVWSKIRASKDTAGNYILPFAGLAQPEPAVENHPGGGPIKPAGEILGYPVYTNRWLPGVGDSNRNG